MSTRVHSNIAHHVGRRLPQVFGGTSAKNAVTNASPNSLNTNKPRVEDAMGMSGIDGIVSFIHDYVGEDPDFTVWYWSQMINDLDPAQGWVKCSEAAAGHTKTVPAFCLAAFTCPEKVPIFIQSDADLAIRNLYMGGASKHDAQTVADLKPKDPNST